MLEKEKLLKTEHMPQINTFHEDRVENMYAYTMHQQFQENETLQKSKFNSKDSDQMLKVKACLQSITNKMREEIPKNEVDFGTQYAALLSAYVDLTNACNEYLISHPHPMTIKGKTRKRLVHGTLAMAEKELAGMRDAVKELKPYLAEGMPLVWGNVLGIIRGASFNLKESKMKLGHAGAAISELTVMHPKGEKMYFYKADEKLEFPADALRKELQELYTNPEDQLILENVLKLVDYHVDEDNKLQIGKIDPLFYGQNSKLSINQAFFYPHDIKEYIESLRDPSIQLNMNDQRTWDILHHVLPNYQRLRTRLGVSFSAGIQPNQSLTNRNVATSRMAAVFGMPNLVVATNKATLHENGVKVKDGDGIAMSQAKGVPHAELLKKVGLDKSKLQYTPEALRQFSCLHLFDTLCGQCDRHWNNRFVTFEAVDGRFLITGVQGIDNDVSFGALKYEEIAKNRIMKLPPFETAKISNPKAFKCSITHLDKEMVETMRHLTKENLKYYLGDLLEVKYIDAMWDRMQHMLETIDRSVAEKTSVLLEEKDWKSIADSNNYTSSKNGYL